MYRYFGMERCPGHMLRTGLYIGLDCRGRGADRRRQLCAPGAHSHMGDGCRTVFRRAGQCGVRRHCGRAAGFHPPPAVLGAEMEQSGFCGSIERLYPCADSRGTTPHPEPHRCGSGRCRVCFTGSRGIRTAGARPPGERNIAGNTHAAQVPVRRNARRGGHRLERFVRLDTVVRTV